MHWFQLIPFDESISSPFLTDSEFFGNLEPWGIETATKVEGWSSNYWVRCSTPECDGQLTDALQNHLGLPIYSIRLREELSSARMSGIQFLPVKVIRSTGAEVKGYAIGNVLNLRSALDLRCSDYDVHDSNYFLPDRRGRISAVRRPVLNSTKLAGVDIVRLREFPASVFVSEYFREVFLSNDFKGNDFRQVDTSD